MRNPPDAFHNSAGALAQHNLVGIIIQAIKMQSLGIFKRLTNFVQTINDSKILENIETVATILKTTISSRADVHKMRKYFFSTRQTTLKNMIKSTVSIWRQKQQQTLPQLVYKTLCSKMKKLCKNLIKDNKTEGEDEDGNENKNEYKTFKHFSTQETHVSRCANKHGKIWHRKLRKSPPSQHLCQQNNKTKKLRRHRQHENGNANRQANTNLLIQPLDVSFEFENHIKQQEILHKFNNIFVTTTTNKFQTNTYSLRYNNSIKFFANFVYWLIILPFSVFALSLLVNLPAKSLAKPFKKFHFHSCTHNLMLKWLKANVNNIWWHIVYMANNMVKILANLYRKFCRYLNSRQASTLQTTTAVKAIAATAILTKTTSSLSSSLSTQSLATVTTTTTSSCSPILSSSSLSTSSSSSQVTASVLPCSTLLFCR